MLSIFNFKIESNTYVCMYFGGRKWERFFKKTGKMNTIVEVTMSSYSQFSRLDTFWQKKKPLNQVADRDGVNHLEYFKCQAEIDN